MLYFDHSATTQPSQPVLDTMLQVAQNYYGNPSSVHRLGEEARRLLDQARSQIAELLHFDNQEIFFTSSGTESNNWVLQKIVKAQQAYHPQRNQVLLSAVEHPSITAQIPLLQQMGIEVLMIPVSGEGQIDIEAFKKLLSDQVLLVSTMAVNNEIGAVQPLAQIADCLADYKQILWHVDGVQAIACQMDLLHQKRMDLLTLTSHKFHSVRGLGLLAIRNRVPKAALLHGGGQESGWRSSTENLPAIVATAKALRLAWEGQKQAKLALTQYRQQIVTQLETNHWQIFGGEKTSAHIICAALPPLPGEVILHAFSNHDVMISTSSACSSRKAGHHPTLQAMGISEAIAQSAVRISMSQMTSQDQVDQLCQVIDQVSQTFNQDKKGVK
ncbi:cysteine desulfurase [Facklamia sp. DSM 111018]|uniref:Cysteine desulfurase n=1 Tax=Facklamia lactis TaxID=2749967 RepID=A0ABS0LNN8_9LACT|nr:cysteine desulfurase family protein [Facklamia lactis]MBG9979661.1 cysteine desulfurase [Facklamia lactis]MBG9985659.1 cysteine desulfurase [Facklamia lactis]